MSMIVTNEVNIWKSEIRFSDHYQRHQIVGLDTAYAALQGLRVLYYIYIYLLYIYLRK